MLSTTIPEPLSGRLFLKGKHVHFIGIGGCAMNGLARIALARGAICTGSEISSSATVAALIRDGIPVSLSQTKTSLPNACDLVVRSAAIAEDNSELSAAVERGIPVLKYAEAIGNLMLGQTGVAVAGTHGKSSTTSMVAHIMLSCGRDPTFIVGANCEQIGGGARVGSDGTLVVEACEYDRSFLNFRPTHAAILNVEEDHLDTYGSFAAIVATFREFAGLIEENGSLLIAHDGAHRTEVAASARCLVETIGFAPTADWSITVHHGDSCQIVRLSFARQVVCEFECRLPGDHMASNACAAAVLTHRLGVPWRGIAQALSSFRGLDRRIQVIGEFCGVTVVSDYGHHPSEIDATLRALRATYYPHRPTGRLICVFQPHQHSRTRFLLEQFAQSFTHADVVIVPDIYFVRDSEEDRRAVSADDLVRVLHARGVVAERISAFDHIVQHVRLLARPGDLVVVMGAGPVWRIAADLLEEPQRSASERSTSARLEI